MKQEKSKAEVRRKTKKKAPLPKSEGTPKANLKETDLYAPIKAFLQEQGYTVRSEVKHCDIVAKKDSELIVIEMKLQFSVDLLIQATKRQQLTNGVYIAIPRPGEMGRRSRWPGIKRILRQLEIGLILVSPGESSSRVEIVFHPLPYRRVKRKKARRAVLREVNQRSDDYNVGGSNRRKLMTAYRESAILIACALKALGPSKPKSLRALGTGAKTLSILSNNYYSWFSRIDRGIYALTPQGELEIDDYPELTTKYQTEIAEKLREMNKPEESS